MTGGLWRVRVDVPDVAAAEAAVAALDGVVDAVSAFEGARGESWQVEGLSRARPDRGALGTRLALVGLGAFAVDRVPLRDWLAENQAAFPPLAVARYFVHGGQYRAPLPAGSIGLLIDAATAFGTGEHATTRGCLVALDRLARRRRRCRRILDMGTGTGILAIAAAKTWRCRTHARDTDAEAVRVARHNARRNGVAGLVAVRRGAGYGDRALRRAAPFDLVFANILARPLIAMARDLRRVLAPGGVAVLSGLLARQERAVLAAHRRRGLRLVDRVAVSGWHTLVVGRAAATPSSPHRGGP